MLTTVTSSDARKINPQSLLPKAWTATIMIEVDAESEGEKHGFTLPRWEAPRLPRETMFFWVFHFPGLGRLIVPAGFEYNDKFYHGSTML